MEGWMITKDQEKEIILPYELKMHAMNTYIREANRSYQVRIYKIECEWDQSQPNEQTKIDI